MSRSQPDVLLRELLDEPMMADDSGELLCWNINVENVLIPGFHFLLCIDYLIVQYEYAIFGDFITFFLQTNMGVMFCK